MTDTRKKTEEARAAELPPEVRRHLARRERFMAAPIPTDRPTLEQMTSGPAFKRSRLLKRALDAGDSEGATRIQAMSDAEILEHKES